MQNKILFSLGLAGLLLAEGCHKAAPVAAAPPPAPAPQTQVATSSPAERQSPVAPVSPSRQAERPTRSASLTPEERATLNDRLARLEDALFDYDKAAIRTDATTALKEDVDVIRGILANYPNQKLIIEGHADERGSEEYNVALGDKRARAAQEFLTTMGIPNNQLTVISYGKDRPVCTDASEACWQRNRRAHVTAAP